MRLFIIRNEEGWYLWDRKTDVKIQFQTKEEAIKYLYLYGGGVILK